MRHSQLLEIVYFASLIVCRAAAETSHQDIKHKAANLLYA